MLTYETLMLARTEITDDELSTLEKSLDKILGAKDGKMTLFDKWGKYKLAYPVKKNVYGIYILARYEVPEQGLAALFNDIETLFKIKYNELIMRHVNVRLEGEISSIYAKPEPVASHRTSNLDSFIKEHKMKGLIDTRVEKKAKEKEETPEPTEEAKEDA